MDTVALFVDVDSFCQNLPDAAGLHKAATVGRATPAAPSEASQIHQHNTQVTVSLLIIH